MKTTVLVGLAFGALALAGCSSAGVSDEDFCATYNELNDSFSEMDAASSLIGSAPTIDDLHTYAAELSSVVSDIEDGFGTLKANTSDAEVKDALDTFLEFGIKPVGDLADAASEAEDMEALFAEVVAIQTALADHDDEMRSAVDVLSAYTDKTCPASTN